MTSVITVDEIISTLGRTSLPSVLVEGKDDVRIFRRLEEQCGIMSVSVMQCGGREALLEVYRRRREITSKINIVFVADKDLWMFRGVPGEYENERLILSEGYSIENDLYVDQELENVLVPKSRADYQGKLQKVVRWYSININRLLRGEEAKIDLHPSYVLNKNQYLIITGLKEQEEFPQEIYDLVISDYKRFLRGKTLLDLIISHMRECEYQKEISVDAFFDIASARPGTLLSASFSRVKALVFE